MDVSCRATRILVEAAESVGVSRERIAEGSRYPLEHLVDVTKRIDWASFAAVNERVWELIDRDPERGRLVGEGTVGVPSAHFLNTVAGYFVSPRQIYEAGGKWVAPALFPHLRLTTQQIAVDQLRVTGEIPDRLVGCEPFFRFCTAALAAQPRVIGLPDAKVVTELSPRRSVSVVTLPRSRSLVDRARRRVAALTGGRAMVALLDAQRHELDASFKAALHASDDFRLALENMPDMVLLHRAGIIVWVNRALASTLGYDRGDELVGRATLDVVHPDDRTAVAERMRRPPLDASLPALSQFRLVARDGAEIVAEIAPAQEVVFGGASARLVAARDVTERVRMQQKLVLADRMASLGVLAAQVAHEVNNPLAYAIGNVELATRHLATSDADAARESLATALEGLDRVRVIVRDLKTFSRADEERLGPVDVRLTLESTLRLAGKQATRDVEVTRDYAPAPLAWASAARLGQVFLNLIVNAVEAMSDHGAASAPKRLHLRTATDEAGRVVVEVEDTGEGIAPSVAARIFEPFFTTKPVGRGTGLGLAVCHQIVTGFGGTIAVRSTSKGTTFRVTLPPAPVESAAPPSSDPEPPSSARRARVLIVDDEAQFAQMLAQVLEPHVVSVATSARAALQLIATTSYDVILCDLMMPELSGPDLHEELARTRPELCDRMVFMSGGAFTDRAREFLAKLPNRFLEKPFEGSALLAAIDAQLSQAPGRVGGR